ncbi:MAG: hypothetical protein AB7U83_19980 [Vicinamibacterales bacterium]
MADDSLIPDELLRQIIGVGQVDLLVGLPTFEHGESAVELLRAVRAAFRSHFPRQRTALLNVDHGSSDGTVEALYHRWQDEMRASGGNQGLRTTHFMTASATAWAEEGAATRCILAAGDLLQASAVIVLDADVAGLTPAWVARLGTPLGDGRTDLVAPVYQRSPVEGLLVTQLVRPLMRVAYGRHLHEPLLAEFGCSGRLAAHCTQAAWTATPVQRATSVWVAGEALAGPFSVCQVPMGARRVVGGRPRVALPDLFRQVVGSTFATLEAHGQAWTRGATGDDPPLVGEAPADAEPGTAPPADVERLLGSFADDVATLDEVLRRLLGAETLAALVQASRQARPGLADGLWAAIVAEFLVAHHHGVMRRDHVVQALLPLYTARTGTFLLEHGGDGPAALDAALTALGEAFAHRRAEIVERWLQPA